MNREPDHTLEFLLAFDGRVHHLEKGYWIKFEIKRVEATKRRPFGLSYSFALHAPDGTRLVGFDNAHGVAAVGSQFKRRSRASERSLAPHGERSRETLRVQRCRHIASGLLSGSPPGSDRARNFGGRCQG